MYEQEVKSGDTVLRSDVGIRTDRGFSGLLIKMSVSVKAAPCRGLPAHELMRHLTVVFSPPCPKGYVIILSYGVHLCLLIST